MRRSAILALAAAVLAGGAVGEAWFEQRPDAVTLGRSVLAILAGSLGRRKAFCCCAEHYGLGLNLYTRAKIGPCGCATAIDDNDIDRISDLDLIRSEQTAFRGRNLIPIPTEADCRAIVDLSFRLSASRPPAK